MFTRVPPATPITQIVFDHFTDIDVFLAWDLLNRVRRPDWTVKLVGTNGYVSVAGLTIPMHGRIEESADADAVPIASGPETRALRLDRTYLGRLRLDPGRQLIGSMCSGALILEALGLLYGKRTTTHPLARDLLASTGVTVVDEPFVREGNVATAAACLAGVDLAAWIIESLLGAAAREAALDQVLPSGDGRRWGGDRVRGDGCSASGDAGRMSWVRRRSSWPWCRSTMARAAARDALTRTTMGSAPKFRLVAGGLRSYMLARTIANGVESKRARIIYPSMYALSRHFPNLTRWALDHLTPPIKAFAPAEERPAGKPEKT